MGANNHNQELFTKNGSAKQALTGNSAVGGSWIRLKPLNANAAVLSLFILADDGSTYVQVDEVLDGVDNEGVVIRNQNLFPLKGIDYSVDGTSGDKMIITWG